jgi:poly(hydroxyalkanoate) granule-associated protein
MTEATAMTEATPLVPGVERMVAAAERTSDAIMHSARRLWLAGLGIFAVAAEQTQMAFETLEQKGEEIEPALAAPFRRAGQAANSLAQRAGQSVKGVGGAVNSATTSVTGLSRRFKTADIREEVSRIVDEKLLVALEQLDLPSRNDFRALTNRIDELSTKAKRGRESHAD